MDHLVVHALLFGSQHQVGVGGSPDIQLLLIPSHIHALKTGHLNKMYYYRGSYDGLQDIVTLSVFFIKTFSQ